MTLFHILPITVMMAGTLGIATSPLLSSNTPHTIPISGVIDKSLAESGIQGQSLIGNLCPVMQVGVNCPARPYQATITILNHKGQILTRFQTNEEGKFKIELKPGKYTLRPESPGILPQAAEQTIQVMERRVTAVQVIYDSGIR